MGRASANRGGRAAGSQALRAGLLGEDDVSGLQARRRARVERRRRAELLALRPLVRRVPAPGAEAAAPAGPRSGSARSAR